MGRAVLDVHLRAPRRGNFMGKGGLRCAFKGASAGNFMSIGGGEGVAFAWDLARPPGTFGSLSRGFLHDRMCCLAVVLSAVCSSHGLCQKISASRSLCLHKFMYLSIYL